MSDARGTRRFEEYFDAETTANYITKTDYSYTSGRSYISRGFSFQLGWEAIQRDTATFLFGYGLGARSTSSALGIAGQALLQGDYGLTTGTTLLVIMQELGMLGLFTFAAFIVSVVIKLWQAINKSSNDDMNALRFGLMMFTLFWPLWIWYHRAWDFSVYMLFYWVMLGYVFCSTRTEN